MMECKVIRKKLSPFLEGDVSPEENRLIGEHLQACQRCSNVLEDLKKTQILIKGLEEVEPPPWFKQRVMARIRAEEEAKKNIFQKLFYPLHVKVPIEAFAVVLIAVAVIYVFKTIGPEMSRVPLPSSGRVAFAPRQEMASPKEDSLMGDKRDLARSVKEKERGVKEERKAAGVEVKKGESKAERSKPLTIESLPEAMLAKKGDEALKQDTGPLASAPAEKAVPGKDVSPGDRGDLPRPREEREKEATEEKKTVVAEVKEDQPKAETSEPVPSKPPPEIILAKKEEPIEDRRGEVAGAAEPPEPQVHASRPPPLGAATQQEEMTVAAGERAGGMHITIQVTDVKMATGKVKGLLGQMGAQKIKMVSEEMTELMKRSGILPLMKSASPKSAEVISAEIQTEKIKDLFEKLASIGEVKEKGMPSDTHSRNTAIKIEIVPNR